MIYIVSNRVAHFWCDLCKIESPERPKSYPLVFLNYCVEWGEYRVKEKWSPDSMLLETIVKTGRLVITHKSENGRILSHFAGLDLFFASKYTVVKDLRYPNMGMQKMWVITRGRPWGFEARGRYLWAFQKPSNKWRVFINPRDTPHETPRTILSSFTHSLTRFEFPNHVGCK